MTCLLLHRRNGGHGKTGSADRNERGKGLLAERADVAGGDNDLIEPDLVDAVGILVLVVARGLPGNVVEQPEGGELFVTATDQQRAFQLILSL